MEYKVFYECDKNKCSIKKYRDKQTHKMICDPCKLTSDPNHAKNEESVRMFEEFFKRFDCSILFIGCKPMEKVRNDSDTSMFVEIEHNGLFRVVAHKETRVMYVISLGGYNAGNFTLLVNPDGTPMLYEED